MWGSFTLFFCFVFSLWFPWCAEYLLGTGLRGGRRGACNEPPAEAAGSARTGPSQASTSSRIASTGKPSRSSCGQRCGERLGGDMAGSRSGTSSLISGAAATDATSTTLTAAKWGHWHVPPLYSPL